MAYTPLGSVQEIPALIEQKVQEIPRYEDSGIKFQGKFKVQTGQNSYELKGQQTRFYIFGANALGDTTFTRENKSSTVFHCTKIMIQNHAAGSFGLSDYQTLSDNYNGNQELRFAFFNNVASESVVFDCSDCPRKFYGDFTVQRHSAGGAEFIIFHLYGWEEQK